MKANYHFLGVVALVLMLGLTLGCQRREKQYTVEAQLAMRMLPLSERHDVESPGIVLTNLSQLVALSGQQYPHVWHRRFAAYGKHAGFTNSIYEKYVFFPRGITNYVLDGELVFMNARPYPDPDGSLGRSVVSKANGGYRWRTLRDEQVQRLFKEAGIKEPTPIAMPAPPSAPPDLEYREPLSTSIARFYGKLAESFGIDGGKWWIFRDATIAVLLIGFLVTIRLIWRTRTRQR